MNTTIEEKRTKVFELEYLYKKLKNEYKTKLQVATNISAYNLGLIEDTKEDHFVEYTLDLKIYDLEESIAKFKQKIAMYDKYILQGLQAIDNKKYTEIEKNILNNLLPELLKICLDINHDVIV